jgi:hypothetical protein
MVGANDLINFSLSEVTTILAGAGALVTGLTAAKILAGSAAITNATRTQVNEVFYQNALKAAIIQKINSSRTTLLQTIDINSYFPAKVSKKNDASDTATTNEKNDVASPKTRAQRTTTTIDAAKQSTTLNSTSDAGNENTQTAKLQAAPDQDQDATTAQTDEQRTPTTLASYSVEDMLNAVENYHNTCSFYAGVTGLSQSTTTYSPQDVNSLIKTIKETSNGGNPSQSGNTGGGTGVRNTPAAPVQKP